MPLGRFISDEMDVKLLRHLPPYQLVLYNNNAYTPSSVSFEEQSSTATNTNDASSMLSSLGSSSCRTDGGSSRFNKPQIGTENSWIRHLSMSGQRLGANSSIPKMKNFWEQTAEKERVEAERVMQQPRLQRPYDFPKWRSFDAMTASLVASSRTSDMIPADSRLPQHRINKIHENELQAQKTKQLIHEQSSAHRPVRQTTFNASMCLAPEDFDKQHQWYDREQIRSSIENPSIANLRETRNYFEQASRAEDFKNQLIPRPFVADRVILSQVPLNQTLSVQCQPQQNFAPSPQISPALHVQQHQYNNSQNVYSQPQSHISNEYQEPVENGRPMSFLEREVLEVVRREREHREQQQRLGHLTLEDVFELWRNGNTWDAVVSRPNSSSGFHDFENHDSGIENLTTSSNNN